MGYFKANKLSFKKYGDSFYYRKIYFKENPNSRFEVVNFLGTVIIFLLDTQLIKEYYLNQQNYIKHNVIDNFKRLSSSSLLFVYNQEHTNRRKALADVFHHQFVITNILPSVKKICDE